MVRLDVYRLARIVESFARCYAFLTIHCIRDDEKADCLEHRRSSMRELCEKSLAELKDRLARRNAESPELADEVRCYVENVIKRVEESILGRKEAHRRP